MPGGTIPRPSDEGALAFRTLVPDDPSVVIRPMFGNIAAFINGNMFAGLFGEDLFVRLSEEGRAAVISQGGSLFAPMPGRPMKDYVVVPPGWRQNLDPVREWVTRSLALARELPVKEGRRRRS
jgi:TfoX/Sxy family transcriptional regulator of competence genes